MERKQVHWKQRSATLYGMHVSWSSSTCVYVSCSMSIMQFLCNIFLKWIFLRLLKSVSKRHRALNYDIKIIYEILILTPSFPRNCIEGFEDPYLFCERIFRHEYRPIKNFFVVKLFSLSPLS
jgi:hypothetical protein